MQYFCDGEGHFARHCPSQAGPDGKASGTMNCHGCNGKGHMKQDCPTANPALKGKGMQTKEVENDGRQKEEMVGSKRAKERAAKAGSKKA